MTKQVYLVGFDGSEWSVRAAEQAVSLAESTGAKIKLIYAIRILLVPTLIGQSVAPPVYDHNEEEKRINNKVIKPIIEKFAAKNVHIEHELIWGDPNEILTDCIKKEHADLLFVGRRGRSRITDLLLGSVANNLAHTINIPIVLVP
ncbi:universal stress protein [Colwelliaceae bacterium BS250]